MELFKKKGLDATKIVGVTVLGIAKGIVEDCAVCALLVNYVVPATAGGRVPEGRGGCWASRSSQVASW